MEHKQILNESIETLTNGNFDPSLIIDNKLCFSNGEKFYRTRMPNQGEQSLAEHKRNLIQLEYLKQEGCITKTQLIEQLKNDKVFDILDAEKHKEELMQELKVYWFNLATKDSMDKKKIMEYSEKIKDIQNTLQKQAIDIATYLTPCLESRIEKYYIEYLTSLCTEQKTDKDWVRAFENYESFNNTDASLSGKAIANMTWLLLNRG